MAILHGSWLKSDRALFLWGETWRSLSLEDGTTAAELTLSQPRLYPFATEIAEMEAQLTALSPRLLQLLTTWQWSQLVAQAIEQQAIEQQMAVKEEERSPRTTTEHAPGEIAELPELPESPELPTLPELLDPTVTDAPTRSPKAEKKAEKAEDDGAIANVTPARSGQSRSAFHFNLWDQGLELRTEILWLPTQIVGQTPRPLLSDQPIAMPLLPDRDATQGSAPQTSQNTEPHPSEDSSLNPDCDLEMEITAGSESPPEATLSKGSALEELDSGEPQATIAVYLHPWIVSGVALRIDRAIALLDALPLGGLNMAKTGKTSTIGADLRYWSHVGRWSLDLLARGKFVPALVGQSLPRWGEPTRDHSQDASGLAVSVDESLSAYWQPLINSARDVDRLVELSRTMPLAARASDVGTDRLPPASEAIVNFLTATIDTRLRQFAAGVELPNANNNVKAWSQGLIAASQQADHHVDLIPPAAIALNNALTAWTEPIQEALNGTAAFRVVLTVCPPTATQNSPPGSRSGSTATPNSKPAVRVRMTPGNARRNATTASDRGAARGAVPPNPQTWQLRYGLQAIDDPDCVLDAATIWKNPVDRLTWQGRTIVQPQETLLAGLGRASRLYPVLEKSLNTPQPIACELDPIQAYEFLKSYRWRLTENGLGVILPPSLTAAETWSSRLGLSIRALDPGRKRPGLGGLLNFEWDLTIAGQRISQSEFQRIISQGSPLVEVNGMWVELRMADVRAANEFFQQRREDFSLSLEDALRISSGDTQTIAKLPVVQFEASGTLQELLESLSGRRTIEPVTEPPGFVGSLRPYQARGVGWMRFLERWGLGACLADDMGLGKTIQTIALLLSLQADDQLNAPTLLICPTSVLGNWEREVHKFAPDLSVLVHHGDKRSKDKTFAKQALGVQLVITSYALVQRDLDSLKAVTWRAIVLDEAQNIKNATAKQSQAVRQLTTEFRLALTGTPVENRLSELWSILDFLNPGYLGSLTFFRKRFVQPIEKYGDSGSLTTLRSLVQPFILRRLKTDQTIIQDLPEKQEMTVFCPLTLTQAVLYQKTVEAAMTAIETSSGIERHGQILALLTKLKQICNHPELLGLKSRQKKPSLDDRFAQASGKLQRLGEMLEEVITLGDRALIFTQFAEWGKVLQPYLEQHLGCEALFLYGATRKAQREALLDRFQNDPQAPPILILSLKAGGTGLNLTRANHVFHFDRWWNPAVENQATDRAFRIGQTRNVQVHKFVCSGTLEERIHALIESKQALADQTIGAGESWLTELDSDGLRNLLLLDRSAAITDD